MILAAVAILGGVGLVFAVLIALADRKLKVWEDPRIDAVASMLPNANCGACGVPGCHAFAEKLVAGEMQPAGCNVANADAKNAIAAYLGVDAGSAVKTVARMRCAGGAHVAVQQAEYRGYGTCAAAAAVAGGGKGCAWGCLGLADCVRSCTFGAMMMSADGIPVVDIEKCTACGDCVEACPKDPARSVSQPHRRRRRSRRLQGRVYHLREVRDGRGTRAHRHRQRRRGHRLLAQRSRRRARRRPMPDGRHRVAHRSAVRA
jgi:Na+-translocating ferredoxin:NAD+ oxidoreductase RNF subunit RnfB